MRHHHRSSPSSSSVVSRSRNPFFICKHHTSSETLDILIIVLALFSATFLVTSYLSYVIHTLSLLNFPLLLPLLTSASILFLLYRFIISGVLLSGCRNKGCMHVDNPNEVDIRILSEECLKAGGDLVKEVERLPCKGVCDGENPEYEALRQDLRRMAPVNGRAVLLFRDKCGCTVAKLEGWGPIVRRSNRKHRNKQ